MPLYAKDKGGSDFEPLEAGLHHAVCYGLVDLGTQIPSNPNFKLARKVAFLFEIPSERVEFEKDGVKKNLPRTISAQYTNSLHVKSALRPVLEGWRGRPFTPNELEKFDLETVLGANCMINVVRKAGEGQNAGKVYANVSSISPLMKGTAKHPGEHPRIFFSLDDIAPGAPVVVPPSVPDWLKGKILQSEECTADESQKGRPGVPTEKQMANLTDENLDEDVPF